MVQASGFGTENRVRFQMPPKDPPSICGVCARKSCESSVVDLQFTVVYQSLKKNFPPLQRQIKIAEAEMNGAAIYR